ncbi:hypothetical protein L207DRAFT_521321 [Hyaloscypha variabilis F]|uniref:Fungal-specific transcription factor domain-containing protein n=1 Tax=Hyaloscypha variabilis (strain UAMH 11265 / GT02V1 / F) TaxID=1149755 RepID=A0A2J6QRN0_HYAVF|nr:hypothetical protein L207DRAFT_521321 [Hyaloscypha variabilis F]
MAGANSQPSFDEDQNNEHGIENAENVPKPEISPQERKAKRSRDKLAKATPQLRFITTTNPEQDKDHRTRKIVRSHVARQYHVVRQQAWKDGEELQGGRSANVTGHANAALEVQGYSQQMLRQPTGSLVTAVGPGGTDPFSSCSLDITPRMNILIDHFLNVVGPQMNAFAINSSNTTDPIKTIYIPFSISDPCVFHGLLLLSAQSFAKISGDTSYRITALTHKAECIRLVNKALGISGKATCDATIAAVLMLAVEELLLGNLEVFKTHLSGLQSMVSIRGGLHTLGLGGILKQLALSCDRACEIFTGSRPLFTLPENLSERPPATALPPGFHKIVQSSGINRQITGFITDAQTTSLIKMYFGYEGTTDAELRFSDTHCNFVSQHIDQISSQYMITSEAVEVPPLLLVEECLSYGLLAYRMVMLRPIPPDPYFTLDVGNRLKTALMRTEFLLHWQGQFDLLLWIAFMGASTTTKGPLRDWYVFLLSGINGHLGTKSWGEINGILEKFLWIGRCQSLGRVLWFEVEGLSTDLPLHEPSVLT